MIQGRKTLGLIPARGGSKGVVGKNLRPLRDKPLLAWTIEAAKQSQYLDRIVLSSDDEAIMAAAREWGCEVPFQRPAALARDDSPTMDAVYHTLESLPGYDTLVLLQPTSPLRSAADIDRCLELSLPNKFCVSVTKSSESPFWSYYKTTDGKMIPVLPSNALRRQDLPETFIPNGAVYVADVKELLRCKGFFTEHTVAYEMPPERSVDIDTEADFAYLEFLFSRPYFLGNAQHDPR